MPDYEAVIFDLDGTLLDSMGIWAQIDLKFLQRRGLPAPDDDYIQAVTPLGFQEAAEYTINRFHLEESPEELLREWKLMGREAYAHTVRLKPCTEEYLLRLKQSGVKLGVATALSADLYRPALARNGVLHQFDAFASLDEVKRGKGFPDVYRLAAERLGVAPSQCMVFEDILIGILAAKSAGFQTCGVYDPYSESEWEHICAAADLTIRSFESLVT